MKFIPASRNRQRGAVLLVLLGILAIGASWFLVSKLDAMSASFAARDRNSNAVVLNRAKQALIGYVAAQALKSGENNPGSLPCPENPGDFDSTTGTDGRTGTGCGTSLKVGRFPWRTIGTEKLVDASGEPLWYVVSTNWGVPTGGNTSINSNSVGQLTLDGVPNAAIALIIAPGSALAVQAAAGCNAWNQARPVVGPPDWRNYLECDNATSPADASFVTTGPAGSFNDQVMRVTVADIIPAIEAAIANRIEREIAPALKTVFASNVWAPNISAANPLLPFAAPFADPAASNYQGGTGLTAGLLPFNQTVGCNPATDPRCTTTMIEWSVGTPPGAPPPAAYDAGGYGYIQTQSCSWQSGGDVAQCLGEYHENSTYPWQTGMRIEMSVTLNKVAMGLRTLDITNAMTVEARDASPDPWITRTVTHTKTLNPNGSMTFTFGATLPNIDSMGWNTYAEYRIRFDRSNLFGDHALLDPTSTGVGSTGWFVRNEWYRLLYYAVASGHTAAGLPAVPACTTGGTCLSVANGDPTRPIAPVGGQRAILILAGGGVAGQLRPSAAPADYLEFGNATGAYERQPIKRSQVINAAQKIPFNDRIIVVGSN